MGNINMSGQIYDTTGVLQLNGSGNIVLAPTGIVQAFGDVSVVGNVTGNYFIGNGSQLTGIAGGGGTPGGANTQLQFNNDGAFAGNARMTFDTATGNIGLGNLIIGNTNTITSVNSFTSNTTPNPGRINVGSGKNGDYSATADPSTNARGSRMWIVDEYVKPDNGLRTRELVVTGYANLAGGNIGSANGNSRIGAAAFEQYVLNGNMVSTIPFVVTGVTSSIVLGQAANTGNANVAASAVYQAFANVNAGSTANTITGYIGVSQLSANVGNMVGYNFINQGTANVTGNVASFYHSGGPGTTSLTNQTNSNGARSATNYFAFRNDDSLARSQLGSLSRFHELNANVSISSGNVAVNKFSGQVQQVYLTENVSGVTFSNFVTRVAKPDGTQVNQTDTVTLIIQQGATPYTFALPTGNAAIRYAGNISAVGSTANSTTMVSITGVYNYNTSADNYLITVSPEFV
jgi:hypothetical protein